MNYSKIISVVFYVSFVLFLSCKKDDKLDPSLKVLDKYASFEVNVGANPVLLNDIANATYTTPESRYGQVATIDFRVNMDNTLDVFWIDKSKNRHITRISLENKNIIEEINLYPEAKTGGRFLGFEKMGDNTFVLGYSKNNSFGDVDAEAWFTAFDKTGSKIFSTRIFGEMLQTDVNSKGSPAQAGSSVIRYNAAANALCVYLSHTQKYSDGVRHQGGWVGFLNGTSGEILKNTSGKQIGSGWFYSHNFDQRCLIGSDGLFYMLAHGDAYPRSLGVSCWNHTAGLIKDFEYYKIQNGTTGDNTTLATTGDFTELTDGNIAIAYSTSDTRTKRDLKVSIVSGLKDKAPVLVSDTWVTNYTGQSVGWGTKIIEYGKNILVLWNTFTNNMPTGTFAVQIDTKGNIVSEPEQLGGASLYPAQSVRKSFDNKYLIWVSSGEGTALKIHTIKCE